MKKNLFHVLTVLAAGMVPAAGHAERELGGHYVLLQQTTVISKVPVVADLVSKTRAVSVQHLKRVGDRLVGQGDVCDIQIENSSSLIRTELPAAFKRALPPVRTNATLVDEGGVTKFFQAPQTLVMGAKLVNPRTDPLPSSPHDRRVIDEDGDGHPGVTVRIKGIVSGEVYVAQRSVSSLKGTLQRNEFSGAIEFSTEDQVLGASSKMLKNKSETRPDPQRSFFRMLRVPGDFSCAQAKQLVADWK